jgi:hypothetical protein
MLVNDGGRFHASGNASAHMCEGARLSLIGTL